MDIVEAIRTRRSIRKFKPDPLSKEVLKEILEIATQAPSDDNCQPWEFAVLAGDVLENIKQGNIEKFRSGAQPNPERVLLAGNYDRNSVYRRRQVEIAVQLFQSMGIQREDKEKRVQWMERGFRYFDAPAAIIILDDRSLTESAPLLSLGAVMQTICLSALSYGLGTCAEDQGIMYPEVIRKFVDIPDSKRMIISIAIGYPDWNFPANEVDSTREPLESIATWHGFA
jgi:nitroreductase